MEEALTWVAENTDVLLNGLGILVALASFITGLTSTPKDDSVVSKVRSFLSRFGLLTYKDSPGTLKAPLKKG